MQRLNAPITQPRGEHRGSRDSSLRVALYSHDTMGLGHVRRNSVVAQAVLRAWPDASIMLFVGSKEAGALSMPDGVEAVSLPAYRKELNGSYGSRCTGLSMAELVNLRSETLYAALLAFKPDILIVDKVPAGAFGELRTALHCLTQRYGTRVVLGLRDILDDPDTTEREWRSDGNSEVVRQYYGAIWVYGDPAVYDPSTEYPFLAEFRDRVQFVGYLDRAGHESRRPATNGSPESGTFLCMVGGGQDGDRLAEAFAQADIPDGKRGILLTGPFMGREAAHRIRQRARMRSGLKVIRFVSDARKLIERAEAVVAMGGYNTVCELLSFEKSALVVPRVEPRREQIIRAERLRDLGLIDMLHPNDLSPDSISRWLAGRKSSAAGARTYLNFAGAKAIAEQLLSLASPVRLVNARGA
jgi:predicted glycosyltransferase